MCYWLCLQVVGGKGLILQAKKLVVLVILGQNLIKQLTMIILEVEHIFIRIEALGYVVRKKKS